MKTARLIARDSDQLGAYPLRKATVTIGSSPGNDLVLEDASVSRAHARIDRVEDGFRLVDLDSTNGTYVGGNRLTHPCALSPGDEIRFGRVALKFQTDECTSTTSASALIPRGRPRKRSLSPALSAFATLALMFLGFGIAAFVMNFDQMQQAWDKASGLKARPAKVSPDILIPQAITSPTAREIVKLEGAIVALNYYRTLAGVRPVTFDEQLSIADTAHSHYVVENFADAIKANRLGAEAHTEDASLPGYTSDGARAAAESDVDEQYFSPDMAVQFDSSKVVGNLITAPFHRLNLLSPKLSRVGYGQYCADRICVASLDVNSAIVPISLSSVSAPHPVMFPPDGSRLKLDNIDNEWPSPLSACPGYSTTTGPAITLQLGFGIPARLGGYSLVRDGASATPVTSCAFDAESYVNPDPVQQQRGRDGLNSYGAVMVIPERSLTPGTYTISITVDRPYTWSFTLE